MRADTSAGADRRAAFHAFERTCALADDGAASSAALAEDDAATFPALALRLLEECAGIDCRALGPRLVVGAETEDRFERPLAILRDAFGDALRVTPPEVRVRRTSGAVEVPVMGVQVRCAPAHVDRVRRDLQRRDGRVVEAGSAGGVGVVRAAVPATGLVGYARHLVELAGAGARATVWPSHWAPDDPDREPELRPARPTATS